MDKPKGVSTHKNKVNDFFVVKLHYTAHPVKSQDKWKKETRKGMNQAAWEREYEIKFTTFTGGAVFKNFDGNEHVREIPLYKHLPILRSWDFGYHHPCVVFGQKNEKDILNVGDLMLGRDIGIKQFAMRVKEYCAKEYPNFSFIDYGDPSGGQVKDVSAGKSTISILRGMGINIRYRKSGIKEGVELMRNLLEKRNDGNCSMYLANSDVLVYLIEAFEGGYRFPNEGGELPDKDGFYDHMVDALRYLCINIYRNFFVRSNKEKNNNEEEDGKNMNKRNVITGY